MQLIIDRLFQVFRPVIEELGLSLIDVEWIPAQRRGARRLGVIIARREGSVSLDDCTMVTHALDAMLDQDPTFVDSYTLEVSSPGLDRVIKRRDEYEVFIGRSVSLVLNSPLDGHLQLEGELAGLVGELVFLSVDGSSVSVPITQIKRATLVFKFK